MKIYKVKQYNAIQFKRGGYRVPRRTGWVVCLDRGIKVVNTKKEAQRVLERVTA